MPFFGGNRGRGGRGRQQNQTVQFELDAQGERKLERQLAKIFERAAKAGLEKLGIKTGASGESAASAISQNKDPSSVQAEAQQRRERKAAAASAVAGAAVSAGASFFADRFATTGEALSRLTQTGATVLAQQTTSFAVEEATGSTAAGIAAGQAAGDVANVGFERLFASGREVLSRAREASTGRLEELAAEGFNISDEEIQRLQRYDLRRERNREDFKLRSARLFEDSAKELGISTTDFRGNEKAVGHLSSINQNMARLVDIMNRNGGGAFRQNG